MYLNTHSYFSFKYGTIKTAELLAQMQGAEVRTFALTDINSTAASLNFVRMAPKYDIKPVLGIDFRNGADQLFVAITSLGFCILEKKFQTKPQFFNMLLWCILFRNTPISNFVKMNL